MSSQRLQLALERLGGPDWERFERFASAFLSAEMPDLRTVASPSGDDGRDAELFSPLGDVTQVLQYSVTSNWKQKIRKTAERVGHTIPSAQLLIYVTNQLIGAEADTVKRGVREEFHIFVDVRDRSYFLERQLQSTQTEAACEALAHDIVDPYLASRGVLARRSPVLDSDEAKAAHVYLSLQFRDEVQEKGLTKLSFEALVQAVLIHTSAERRMSREDVKHKVRDLLPGDDSARVDQLTESALARLTKRAIRHYQSVDEFCLTHEESRRVAEYLASKELGEVALGGEISKACTLISPGASKSVDLATATPRVRRLLERCLYARAESFAGALLAGNTARFATDHLQDLIHDDLRLDPTSKSDPAGDPDWLGAVIREILVTPGEATQLYLRELADAHTLMAFLRQTPDVQSAVGKMFSHGEVWMDTSAILPLLVEELLEVGRGQFQQMLSLATQAGVSFFVTNGVVEELDRHINRAEICSRTTGIWEGRYPFLLEAFLQAGRPPNEFSSWSEIFRGPHRPLDDIIGFLQERFSVVCRDLETQELGAASELRHAVQEAWYEIHSRRRERFGGSIDQIALNRLSRHDTENYVGVIQQRRQEKASPLGYSAWWLTLDRSALSISDTIARDFDVQAPDSPILSIDFLAQYLTFGPMRTRVSKTSLRALPVALEPRLVPFLTRDLLDEASRIRAEMKDLPEALVRRRVRDRLDSERRRMGPLAARGVDAVLDEIRQ
jgi:hypothetical protein